MSDDNTQDGAEPTPASAGSGAGEPVAWEVFLPGLGTYDIHSFRWEAAAIAHALLSNEGTIAAICPLFRQPKTSLTDAERKAIEGAIDCCEDITYGGAANQEAADVLKALLERT